MSSSPLAMALDRRGRPVAEGDLVRFAELRHETRVVTVAEAGIYVLSTLIGERFVASSDRCFEVVDEPRRGAVGSTAGGSEVPADHERDVGVEE